MIESLVLVSSGVAVISAIGAYKLGEYVYQRKVARLERQNAYITRRNADLRNRLDAAQRSERDAHTRQFLAERNNAILESQQAAWAKRLLAQKAEQEAA